MRRVRSATGARSSLCGARRASGEGGSIPDVSPKRRRQRVRTAFYPFFSLRPASTPTKTKPIHTREKQTAWPTVNASWNAKTANIVVIVGLM